MKIWLGIVFTLIAIACTGAPQEPAPLAPSSPEAPSAPSIPGSGEDQPPAPEGLEGAIPLSEFKVVSLRLGESPYEMARPALWVQGTVTGAQVLASWVHPEAPLIPNLNVTLESPPATGEAGIERAIEELAKTLPGYEEKVKEWREINGIRGYYVVSSWTSILGDLTATRMVLPWSGKMIVVTFVDYSDTYPLNAPIFDLCINALGPLE